MSSYGPARASDENKVNIKFALTPLEQGTYLMVCKRSADIRQSSSSLRLATASQKPGCEKSSYICFGGMLLVVESHTQKDRDFGQRRQNLDSKQPVSLDYSIMQFRQSRDRRTSEIVSVWSVSLKSESHGSSPL